MFVLAWSLLSSYTDYARKRKLSIALREFYKGRASVLFSTKARIRLEKALKSTMVDLEKEFDCVV